MKTSMNFEDSDTFYENWLLAHEGLNETESFEFNARLILLLANQIGCAEVLQNCITAAVKTPATPA